MPITGKSKHRISRSQLYKSKTTYWLQSQRVVRMYSPQSTPMVQLSVVPTRETTSFASQCSENCAKQLLEAAITQSVCTRGLLYRPRTPKSTMAGLLTTANQKADSRITQQTKENRSSAPLAPKRSTKDQKNHSNALYITKKSTKKHQNPMWAINLPTTEAISLTESPTVESPTDRVVMCSSNTKEELKRPIESLNGALKHQKEPLESPKTKTQ